MRRQPHVQIYAVLTVQIHAAAAIAAPIRMNVGRDTTTDTLRNKWESDDKNK